MGNMKQIILLLLAFFAINIYADIPPGYYNEADGKKDAALKTAMHNIIRPHTRIEYGANGTWSVFRTSDVRSDGSIWDMYSNVVRYFPESGSHSEMHIEHSVPKSWWGEETLFVYEASFDLHQLVPSDASAHMSKSNNMLGEVDLTVATPSLDNGVSKTGKMKMDNVVYTVFEPHDDYKGDFARMYMYVVTCYQDYTWESVGVNMFNSEPYPTLNAYSKELLMKWHRNDPVSAKEINRNEAVYKAQENRNPFIDFPLLAEYLWGDSIGRVFRVELSERPYLLTPSQGERVDMGTVLTGSTVTRSLPLKGVNLVGDIMLSWTQNAGIVLDRTSFSAGSVVDGTHVELYYANSGLQGLLNDTLVISGGGLVNEVRVPVELCGTSSFMPLAPSGVTSAGATLRWVAVPGATSYRVRLYEGAIEATNLFVSAYVEGSSYNKAIALYNGTSRSVNLADYALASQHNGVGDIGNYWQLPERTLAPGGTFVIVCSSCSNDDLRGCADYFMPATENSPINFNGNDVVVLYHDNIMIDVVGILGSANNWGKDVTLYRSASTLGPETNFDVSSWVQAPMDDFALLRSHTMSGITAKPNLVVEEVVSGMQLAVDVLKPSTIYTYYVTALLEDSELDAANGCAFTTCGLVVPVDLYAENIYADCFELYWGEVAGADGYEVECFELKGGESVLVSEGFENVASNGKPLPDGWTGTASGNYTSEASSGVSAPSIGLKNSGEYIQTPEYPSPVVKMSFMYRFASTATGSSLLVECMRNGEWQLLQKIEYENTKKSELDYLFDASENVRAFRFTYDKAKGNMAIDDVAVMYGGQDTVFVSGRRYAERPYVVIRDLEKFSKYGVRVRAVQDGLCSEWSDVLFVETNDKISTCVQYVPMLFPRYMIGEGEIVLYDVPVGTRVLLYDMQGGLCFDSVSHGGVMKLQNQRPGVYLLGISMPGMLKHFKIRF